jgi:hypothetical protein
LAERDPVLRTSPLSLKQHPEIKKPSSLDKRRPLFDNAQLDRTKKQELIPQPNLILS